MPKTPLRALRVSDDLWRAAQARAREAGETVSEVVRRALTEYVGPGPEATATPGGPGPDTGFLLAQGMLMQRLGVDADAAATYLRRLAQGSGTNVRETARLIVDEGADASVGSTSS